MSDGEFRTQVPIDDLQRDYFLYYNFNHWMHKSKALLSYIDGPSDIGGLRFEGDNDSEETIVNGLKMELHMMAFHSSESLFLNVFSITKWPQHPWIWITSCSPQTLHDLIKKVATKGLSSLRTSPEEWLGQNLYPNLTDCHQHYDKSKSSTQFILEYLQLLATEYLDRTEYNSYKHGLRSFVGKTRYQGFDDNTGERVIDMGSDIIEYLELKKKDKSGRTYIENGKPYTLIKRIQKGFNYKRDFQIIEINSAILCNLFYAKKQSLMSNQNMQYSIGYFLFEGIKAIDVFRQPKEGRGNAIFYRFTM